MSATYTWYGGEKKTRMLQPISLFIVNPLEHLQYHRIGVLLSQLVWDKSYTTEAVCFKPLTGSPVRLRCRT